MFANKKIMKIAGIEKCSFVDYEKHISCVVFTQGCNMNCFYCHNKELIPCHSDKELIQEKEIFQFLEKRMKYLDAVVISGGEPTMQQGLEEFIKNIKKMGFKVKLDTNGSNPHIIENLVSKKLIDYVAMDIKAPITRYKEFCGSENILVESLKRTIKFLLKNYVGYEFRTTFAPGLKFKDIFDIALSIKGAELYVIQKCNISENYSFMISDEDFRVLNELKLIKKIKKRY